MLKRFLILLIGAGLWACSSYKHTSYHAERIDVKTAANDATIDSMVKPYRVELEKEMNRVIGNAVADMPVARPNSLMGQWVADVLLRYGKDSLLVNENTDIPVISLLNTGGLRASFSKGDLVVGDVYKVMPFDNQIVALKLPIGQLEAIAAYLKATGGEPIAGFTCLNGVCTINGRTLVTDYVWVVSTDFLANGGDKMYFFQSAVQTIATKKLLRDLLLEEITQKKVINPILEERIRL